MVWLVNHRWWTLGVASALLVLRLVLPTSILSVIPIAALFFLLFFAGLMAIVGHRGSERPPSRH